MTELSETQIQNKVLRWAKRYPYKGKRLADYLFLAGLENEV